MSDTYHIAKDIDELRTYFRECRLKRRITRFMVYAEDDPDSDEIYFRVHAVDDTGDEWLLTAFTTYEEAKAECDTGNALLEREVRRRILLTQ